MKHKGCVGRKEHDGRQLYVSGRGVSTKVSVNDKWVEVGGELSPMSGKYNYKIPFRNNFKTKRKNKNMRANTKPLLGAQHPSCVCPDIPPPPL